MDSNQTTSAPEGSTRCSNCGHKQNTIARATAHGQEHMMEGRFTRLREVKTEQAETIQTMQQELLDRGQRSDAIMAHYQQLVRMERGLARDAEEAELKAETEINALIKELERLQSLLAAHNIVF